MRWMIAIVPLALCGCFGPPIHADAPDTRTAEFNAEPQRAHDAFIACTTNYGREHGAAREIALDSIVDAAIYACSTELEEFRKVTAEHARGRARVLGWIDRSDAYVDDELKRAKDAARIAVTDAVIRARTSP